jgi:hypothetical protein
MVVHPMFTCQRNKLGNIPPCAPLQKIPGYGVLLACLEQRFTGLVRFQRDERLKEIFIKDARVMQIRSNLVPESEENLIERGFSSRGMAEERLLNVAGWFAGTYELLPGVPSLRSTREDSGAIDLEGFFSNLVETLSGNCHLDYPNESDGSRGDFGKTGSIALFVRLIREKATGRLLIERGSKKKMFNFQNGNISSAVSTDPNETLDIVLARWSFLTEKVVLQLRASMSADRVKFRDLLLSKGLLGQKEIRDALQILHTERILEALSWRIGRFEFQGDRSISAHRPPAQMKSEKGSDLIQSIATLHRASPASPIVFLADQPATEVDRFVSWLKTSWKEIGSEFPKIRVVSDLEKLSSTERNPMNVVLWVQKEVTPQRRVDQWIRQIPKGVQIHFAFQD